MTNLMITPKTKIYDLLVAYPQLENVLISFAPQFKGLQNPILRKTIAKISSLSQAAAIGGLKVDELINRLRFEVGQTTTDTIIEGNSILITAQPNWFNGSKISESIDIRDMLNGGEHPAHEVLSAIEKLSEHQILKVIAPFIPLPLIDKTLRLNYQHWVDTKCEEEYWIYFINENKHVGI